MSNLEICHRPARIVLNFDIGTRISTTPPAMGRTYLAGAPAAEVAELARNLEGQRQHADPDEIGRTLDGPADRGGRVGRRRMRG